MDEGTADQRDVYQKDRYPAPGQKELKLRKQIHDRRSQFHAVVYNLRRGQKLPTLVKFPKIAQFFEKLPRYPHLTWPLHRGGLFNGLFIVPDEPNAEFVIPKVEINGRDFTRGFFASHRYRLLVETFNLVYKKLNFGAVVTRNPVTAPLDLSKDETLLKYGKFTWKYYLHL